MINADDLKGISSSDRQLLQCFTTTFYEWRRGKDSECLCTHAHTWEESGTKPIGFQQTHPGEAQLRVPRPQWSCISSFYALSFFPNTSSTGFCQWRSLSVENTMLPRPLSEPALLSLSGQWFLAWHTASLGLSVPPTHSWLTLCWWLRTPALC